MSSTTTKRRRACEACHVLKARCEPGPAEFGSTACERCCRLGKQCTPAVSRRQRDRIADLEAQVAALKRALQAHSISNERSVSADIELRHGEDETTPPKINAKRMEQSPKAKPEADEALSSLDEHVPIALQQKALSKYVRQMFPVLPIVPVESDLTSLRTKSPILLLSIIAFASGSLLQDGVRYELIERIMQTFAFNLIAGGKRTLELVQALQVGSLWYRARPGFKHATVYQLAQMTASEAIDLGIAGPQALRSPAPAHGFNGIRDHSCPEARRIWLASFLVTSSLSVTMRRPDANTWTTYHEECLLNLSTSPQAKKADRLFGQLISAEKLYHRIAACLGLYEPTTVVDLTAVDTRYIVSSLRREIADWTAQVPQDLDHSSLKFCRQIAHIYLNEPVLHTPTNKLTFGIPLTPSKIMAADFARPIVTAEHIAALHGLKDSCQKALDLVLGMDIPTLLALSPLCYIPRISYSIFVLVKLYVALTAPGNTYGTIIDKDDLHLERYFEGLKSLASSLEAVDPTSFNSGIMGVCVELQRWYVDYNAVIEQFERDSAANTMNVVHSEGPNVAYRETVESAGLHADIFPLENFMVGMDSQSWIASYFPGHLPAQDASFD